MRNFADRAAVFARSDFARHGLIVFVATTLQNGLGYAFHFAISRKLGVEQYGVLSALNAAFMLSMVIGAIGATVAVKYAAEFRATHDRAHLAALVRRLTIFGGLGMVLVALTGIACSGAIAGFLKITNIGAVMLTMIVIGFSVVTPPLRAVFSGTEDFGAYSISLVMESVLKAILGIGLVYAGYGVAGAFGGWAIGSFVTLLYTATVLNRRYRRVVGAELSIDFRRLVLTMTSVAGATLLLTILNYADLLVVKHFADPTTAGLYGALSLSGKILLFLVAFVPTVVLPKASRQALAGVSPVGVLLQALYVTVAMSGAGLIVYYVFPAFIITTLAGASFAAAAPYVFSYGVATVLLAGLSVVVTYKMGIHRFDFIVPLAFCAVGEIVAISLHHRTLGEVITVLIVGNAIALVASTWRVNATYGSSRGVQTAGAAA